MKNKKFNKTAQTDILVTVLLVLIALAVVAIVAYFVVNQVRTSTSEAQLKSKNFEVYVKKAEVNDGFLRLSLERGSSTENFTGLKIVMTANGKSQTYNYTGYLNPLETQEISIPLTGDLANSGNIAVDVYPVLIFNSESRIAPKTSGASSVNTNDAFDKSNLVAYYLFDSDAKDYSGNGNDGMTTVLTNFIANGDAESGTSNWAGTVSTTSVKHSGNYGFNDGTDYGSIYSIAKIPINTSKTYYLSGWFTSIGAKNSYFYFGYAPYDSSGRQIPANAVMPMAGTEAILKDACKASDKIVNITNVSCSKWSNAAAYYTMAFNIDVSGSYNDIPNFNLSNTPIGSITNRTTYCEVFFNNSVGRDAAAGTKVREHSDGGTYIYNVGYNSAPNSTWQYFSGTITGETLPQGRGDNAWWKTTKSATILLLTNYGSNRPTNLVFDDLTMTDMPPGSGVPANTLPVVVAGKVGSAYNFDGVDDYLNFGNVANLNFFGTNSSFSVSLWVNVKNLSFDQGFLGKWGAGGAQWLIYMDTSPAGRVLFSVWDGAQKNAIGGPILANNWYHIVGVADNGILKMYVNGQPQPLTGTYGTITASTANAEIGRYGLSHYFNGSIDDARIYNRALSAEEIKALYDATK